MALFDLPDLAAFLQSDVDTATATLLRDLSTAVVVGYTRQNVESATYTHLLPVNADRTIRLPQRPVTAVTSVTIDGDTLVADSDWDWDGITDLVVLDGYSPDRQEWQATVVYTAGYATVPADIKAVALSVAARMYNTTAGLVAESIDDYRAQYAAGGDASALTDGERRLLRRYKYTAGSIAPVAVPGRRL